MRKLALLVVDLVNDFTQPTGKVYYPSTGAMMPAVVRLINQVKEREILTIYIQQIVELAENERRGKTFISLRESCVEGTGGALLDPRLPIDENDPIVVKRKASGFFKTNLEELLIGNGIEAVAIIGTKTNVCVRATAVDASMREFRTYLISDCVSTNTDELNKFHIEDIGKYTAKILTSDELIAMIDSGTI